MKTKVSRESLLAYFRTPAGDPENHRSFWTVGGALCVLLAALALGACTGSKSSTASNPATTPATGVNVSINPPSASVQTGGTQSFSATVTGTSNTGVTWSATGGTISAGTFTAGSTAGTYSVTATSMADATKSASAAITVTAAPPPATPGTASSITKDGITWTFSQAVPGFDYSSSWERQGQTRFWLQGEFPQYTFIDDMWTAYRPSN